MTQMKLGLGLYRHMLTPEYFRFAQQCGCTHIVAHLTDYFASEDSIVQATDEKVNWGFARAGDSIWSQESLRALQDLAGEFGLTIYALENFSPADWYDVLLAGPRRDEQLEHLKQLVRSAGACGIKAIGYNFSIAGVWGHQRKNVARGGAESVSFNADELPINAPIPRGEIWNMTYAKGLEGQIAPFPHDELWARLKFFLDALLPVAEEAGVDLALHPDDPPMPTLRGTPRLVYKPEMYQRLIDLNHSPSNKLEMCLGTLQEMDGMSVYDAIDAYAGQGRVSYVHVRNVRGKVPNYHEVFIDEGDIDVLRALKQLGSHGFDGVLIPDHTPLVESAAPWHAGMAYALGFLRAALMQLGG